MAVSFSVIRRSVQCLAFMLLIVPQYIRNDALWLGNYLSSHLLGIPLSDPLAVLEVTLASKEIIVGLLISAIPLVLAAIILGRVFCSWVCPLNTVLEIAAYIKKPPHIPVKKDWQPFILMGILLAVSTVISLPIFTIVSPIGIVSRAFAFGIGLEVIAIGLLIAIEWFYSEKFWCRRICPAGALYGLLSRYRLLGVSIAADACTNCGECYKYCGMRVDVGSSRPLEIMNCTNCGQCVDVCEKKAATFDWKILKKGGTDKDEIITGTEG